MATWQEPVFDRTQADVDYAKQQLANRVNYTYLKGCFNVTDVSRIENNTKFLADTLASLYYTSHVNKGGTWHNSSLLHQSQISRIINNVDILWKAYYKPSGSATLPNTLLTFSQVNAIEKNHYLIKEMIDNMVGSFRECNTFSCGEE